MSAYKGLDHSQKKVIQRANTVAQQFPSTVPLLSSSSPEPHDVGTRPRSREVNFAMDLDQINDSDYEEDEASKLLELLSRAAKGESFVGSFDAIAEDVRYLALSYQYQDDLMAARDLLQDALPTLIGAVQEGNYCPSKLGRFLFELGELSFKLGESLEAVAYFKNAVQREEESTQPNQTQVLKYLEVLAGTYMDNCNYGLALYVLMDIYNLQLQVYGTTTPNEQVAITLCHIGLVHYTLKNYTSSLNFYQEALQIRMDLFNSSPVNQTFYTLVGDTLNAIGLLYYLLRKYDQADHALSYSLALHRQQLPHQEQQQAVKNLRKVSAAFYNLGLVHKASGNLEKAIQLYKEVLRHEILALGDGEDNCYHPVLSTTYQHLGSTYFQNGELKESLTYFIAALEVERRIVQGILATSPEDSPEKMAWEKEESAHLITSCGLLNVIGNIYLMQGNIPAMMTCLTEASRMTLFLNTVHAASTPPSNFQLIVAGHSLCHLSRLHPPSAPMA